jgi:hypothetical protein
MACTILATGFSGYLLLDSLKRRHRNWLKKEYDSAMNSVLKIHQLHRVLCNIVCALLVATLLSGCLDADSALFARYDAVKDQFEILAIYQHIHGDSDDDLKVLQALWTNRDHMIIGPDVALGHIAKILGTNGILRMTPDTYASVDMGKATMTSPQKSEMPLDQIQIQPGKLFLEADDNLCCYQGLILPGAMFDKGLSAANSSLVQGDDRQNMLAAIDAEITRRKNGGEMVSWDDYTRETIAEVSAALTNQPTPPAETRWPLSNDSLSMLKAAVSRGTLKPFARRGEVLSVSIPLTPADVQSAKTFFKSIKSAAIDSTEKHIAACTVLEEAARGRCIEAMIKAVSVDEDSATAISLHVGLTSLINASSIWVEHYSQATPANKSMASLAADKLKARSDLKINGVIEAFNAKALEFYPSPKPATPGEQITVKP